jgi:plasmid replication initiation protein
MKNRLNERNYSKQSHIIVNAKYGLSTSEINIILTLLTTITKEDKDFKDYEFTLNDFNQKTKKNMNTSDLNRAIKGLMNKSLEIQISDVRWKIFNWFSYFEFDDGLITCRFDKSLKPYLLEIKERFVISDLRILLSIRSSYSKRIYLLLKEYSKLGKRTFVVDELQKMLKTPKSMNRYDNFKRQVLKRAEMDINKFTDLEAKLFEKKRGRKVVEIGYSIRKNQVDLKSFISIIREMYVNKILYYTKDNRPLRCSEKGLLYYSDNNENINKKESQKLWEYLHEHREHLECYEKFDEKEAIQRLILSDLYTFVKYMRENYTNQNIMKVINSKSQKEMMVSISFTGELYDKIEGNYFDRVENQNLWNQIYNLAKRGLLTILK